MLRVATLALLGAACAATPAPPVAGPGDVSNDGSSRARPDPRRDAVEKVEVREAPELAIVSSTMVNGRVTPWGISGTHPGMTLTRTSNDPSYGYSPQNPIRVGRGNARLEYLYFYSLYGPQGQIVSFQRLGGCCPAPEGEGMLDAFEIGYEGLGDRPLILYVDLYEEGAEPMVPMGFTTAPAPPAAAARTPN